MTKQTETIRELKDRVNALEAMTRDLLAVALNSEAQAKIKFDDYSIKYTQEAVEKREAEAKAKRLAECVLGISRSLIPASRSPQF